MKDIAAVKKSETFDEKDFNIYMREPTIHAKRMGEEGKVTPRNKPDDEEHSSDPNVDYWHTLSDGIDTFPPDVIMRGF